jgi:isohexenylglutaconyl-CoA hydratase
MTESRHEFETIRLEAEPHGVRRLTFRRPAQRNALTHRMMEETGRALALVRTDPEARVLVLRGAGGNFCAGGDLNAMIDMPPPPAPGEADPLVAPYRMYGDVLAALNTMPQAVVALVEGIAVGGGFGAACCADLTIVTADARLGMPEPRHGFIPSQIIPFVVRRIGEGQARRLAVTASVIDGREATRLGVAHQCCETVGEAEAALAAALEQLRRCAPQALAAVKRLTLSVAVRSDVEVMDDAAETLVSLLRAPEARAGVEAFLAKRRPPWAD